jgi:hypothetical protein
MTRSKRKTFDEYCRFNRTNTDIWRWLVAEGFIISLTAVDHWRKDTFPDGEQAKILNGLAQVYDGLQGDRSLQAIEGIALSLIRQLTQTYQQAPNKLDPDILKLFALLPSFMREARSAASQREEMKFIKDKGALELAGAQRMADILLLAFKDTTYEDALKEAVHGAMLQIEQEARNQ